MAKPVTYSIVRCPDGRFAVVAVLASGSVHRRDGLLTLAEAEACVETLRVLMEACGARLVRREGGLPSTGGSRRFVRHTVRPQTFSA
jgi:hypothetical protein